MYKIVIVEDDRIIRQSIVQSDWNSIQAEVVGEATDGERGLEVIYETHPHLIVTDINMPFMDGITFAKKVRAFDPTIRIIFLTGYDNFEYVNEAVMLKTDDYLLKPINHEVLLEKAKLALEAWTDENQKQSKLSASIPILQQQFVSKVILNHTEGKETAIDKELIDLGIHLSGPKFVVLSVEISESDQHKELYAYLEEWQVDTEIEVLAYRADAAFILLSIDEQRLSWVDKFIEDIKKTLSEATNQEVNIKRSTIYYNIQDIELGIIETKNTD